MDLEIDHSKDDLAIDSHRQYASHDVLSPVTVPQNPLDQFRTWFAHAVQSASPATEPEAVALATATPTGIPSVRMVLFKRLDSKGFVFFTNYHSRKSNELSTNPHAALAFYWPELHRSVRVVGTVEKLPKEDSAAYFSTRPLCSRLGAWASRQSAVVDEHEVHDRFCDLKHRFGVLDSDTDASPIDVPLPEFWGGWRIIPLEIEFWSGKPSRLHDRVRYLRTEGSPDDNPQWKIDRLAP